MNRERIDIKVVNIKEYEVVIQEVKDNQDNIKFTASILNKTAEKNIDKYLSERVYNNFLRNSDKYKDILEGNIYPFIINVDAIETAEEIILEMLDTYDNRDTKKELRDNVEDMLEGFDVVLNDCYNNFYVDLDDKQKADIYERVKKVIIDYVDSL